MGVQLQVVFPTDHNLTRLCKKKERKRRLSAVWMKFPIGLSGFHDLFEQN